MNLGTKRRMKGEGLLLCSLFVVSFSLLGYSFWTSIGANEAMYWPRFVLALMVFFVLLQGFSHLRLAKALGAAKALNEDRNVAGLPLRVSKLLAFALLLLCFYFSIGFLGFYVASTMLLAGVLFLFEVRRPFQYILLLSFWLGLLIFVFEGVMSLSFPDSSWSGLS
ncbi:hypothetical protein GW916_04845 [bacterium]|nr:hypothetical protein [bacterium]